MPKSKAQVARERILLATKRVSGEISAFARSGDSMYAAGLASEGYNGGYRDALYDVMLVLGGIKPDRNCWWEEDVPRG